jgi:hypothetical protein
MSWALAVQKDKDQASIVQKLFSKAYLLSILPEWHVVGL